MIDSRSASCTWYSCTLFSANTTDSSLFWSTSTYCSCYLRISNVKSLIFCSAYCLYCSAASRSASIVCFNSSSWVYIFTSPECYLAILASYSRHFCCARSRFSLACLRSNISASAFFSFRSASLKYLDHCLSRSILWMFSLATRILPVSALSFRIRS